MRQMRAIIAVLLFTGAAALRLFAPETAAPVREWLHRELDRYPVAAPAESTGEGLLSWTG